MIYQLFKIWAKLAFSLYFRRIFISGKENIPVKGPVLILVNHPNSFLEACVIAAFQHRNLYFLVRGDMFEKKWLLPVLKSTNQIPIYRFKDGFSKLRNNKNTFDQSYEVLCNQHTLLMFPEASSEMVKYLRPLQKGAARLALGVMEEKNLEELHIVPTGIHYFNAPKSRTDVILKFGSAISMREWLTANSKTEDKINELTSKFQSAMEHVVISIKHTHDQEVYDDLQILKEADQLPFKNAGVLTSESAYSVLKKLVNSINSLTESDLKNVLNKLQIYKGDFKNLYSVDASIHYSAKQKLTLFLSLMISFIIGVPGIVFYGPAFVLSKWFAKSKIKHITFYAPVRIAVNMAMHLVMTIMYLIVFLIYFNITETLMILLFLQFSIYSFALFLDYANYSKCLFSIKLLKSKEAMMKLRKEIINLSDTMDKK